MSKKNWTQEDLERLYALRETKTWQEMTEQFPGITPNALRKAYYNNMRKEKAEPTKLKILLIDIETAPIEAFVWQLFDQNVGLEEIIKDWSVLSFCAKWMGKDEVIYQDTSLEKDPRNDKNIIKTVHSLLDEADIVITQNGVRFDLPKLNARFLAHGLTPPSSYRNIDTLKIAKKNFAFTSNKLEYMTKTFNVTFKKLNHKLYPGFSLWKACLAGDKKAWAEMKEYNVHDVLALEELYHKLAPFDRTINFNVYSEDFINRCSCGSTSFKPKGYHYTNRGKYKKYQCEICGKEHRETVNQLSKEKRKAMKV